MIADVNPSAYIDVREILSNLVLFTFYTNYKILKFLNDMAGN